MIRVTRLNNSVLYVNAEMIETVEGTANTVITLTNKVRIIVREEPEILVERILDYQRKVRSRNLASNLGE